MGSFMRCQRPTLEAGSGVVNSFFHDNGITENGRTCLQDTVRDFSMAAFLHLLDGGENLKGFDILYGVVSKVRYQV